MEAVLESAIATGNAWIVFVVVLGVVVIYLWKSLEDKHKQSDERITKLEDKYEAEHEAYINATTNFTNVIREIKEGLETKIDKLLERGDDDD